jgi:ATP-dependent RNA helicase SUPV3L1/SUV3
MVTPPEMVEVWRPGGRSEERRPRHDRSRHRHQDRPQEGAQPAAAAAAGEAGDAAKHQRHRRGRRDHNAEFRKPRPDAPVEGAPAAVAAEGAPAREPREDKGRPPRERFEGKGRDKGKFGGGRDNGGRDKGGRDKGGRDKRPDGGPSHRQYATSAAPRERERPVDPNSPFAKLAALKEQLTANRKDR